MRMPSKSSSLSEPDDDGDDDDDLEAKRTRRIGRIRRVTDRIQRKMKKRASITSWFAMFKELDKNQSGDVSFDELQYVVYNELQISKLELTPHDLRLVWDVLLDRDGSEGVTIQGFASFMRRLETNKIENVIVDAVDQQLARGDFKDHTTTSHATHFGRCDSELTLVFRKIRTIGGYTSLDPHRSFQMGRPPENNDHIKAMVPRLKHDLVFRQEQKLKLFETLASGGQRYPLMLKPRLADVPFAVDNSDRPRTLEEKRSHSIPFFTPLPIVPRNSHWSERLSCNATFSALSRQHITFLDLKHKYRVKA